MVQSILSRIVWTDPESETETVHLEDVPVAQGRINATVVAR